MLPGSPGGNDKPGGTDVRPSKPIGGSIGSSETRASTEFVASSRDGSSSSERLLAQVQSLGLNVKQNTKTTLREQHPIYIQDFGDRVMLRRPSSSTGDNEKNRRFGENRGYCYF
jgi:hypothetical protein